jgi:hypothetical protein
MRHFLIRHRSFALLTAFILLAALILLSRVAQPAAGSTQQPQATAVSWIPIVRHDPTPTAVPTPSLPPSPYEALLQITPSGGINASTFNTDSFILRNLAGGGGRIARVRIDLSTAVFPNMIFDPFGQGGDTLAKDLKVDHKGSAGFSGHSYEGEHGGGFDVLMLTFNSFDPGDEFRFSVDVDPNSIRGVGAPGPNEAGSVSGIELIGSSITVVYEDGAALSNQAFRIPGSDSGSQALLRQGLPAAPQLSLPGLGPLPTTISFADPAALVSGPDWQPVSLLVLEGGMFLEGVPGGGYDVGPYDANSVVAIRDYDAQTLHDGQVEMPVLLSRSLPAAGLNYLVAAFDNHFGMRGATSPAATIEFVP